jgi:chemotaxis protein methyltransferase CheR
VNPVPQIPDVQRFNSFVSRQFGLHFDDDKQDFLAHVLHKRMLESGRRASSYLDALEAPDLSRKELRILAQELTVTETSFFRNIDQMRAFREVALPALCQARAGQRQLRILSAGCASGEEPYSLAVLLREAHETAGWQISIQAIDINVAMLSKAAAARYSAWSLRQTSPVIRQHFFRTEGSHFTLDSHIREMVTFEERNLVMDDPVFWKPDAFDIIFCRNVMMYFSPKTMRQIVARLAHSLASDGFLFLGHAETLRGVSTDFDLCHTHNTFYYQHKMAPHSPRRAKMPTTAPPPWPDAAGPGPISWVDAIHNASERIVDLTSIPALAQETAAHDRRSPAPDMDLAIELLRQEQYPQVEAMLDALPPAAALNSEALLLRAVLLTHGGDLVLAEKVCADLLRQDELNAGAHYLSALCRESAADLPAAEHHDRRAAYLDAAFALPCLHLGLLARRAGALKDAGRELRRALQLLQQEKASRLVLFGGGFRREALIALCRAELAWCGDER